MLNIGKELKELRLLKGLSLKEISEITKINLKYLEYLEGNNFNFLPEVYVKSFLKNYVRALDEDEKKFLSALDEILHQEEPKVTETKKFVSEKTKLEFNDAQFDTKRILIDNSNIITFRNIVFFVGTLILIFILVFVIIKQDKGKEKQLAQTATERMYEGAKEKSGNFDNIAISDSLILGINAKDSVWIQVKMDNKIIQEVYLRNGEEKKFKAKNDFQVLVGNAGAVKLYLNETELPFTGVKGSVRRLKVDKNGVELIQVKNEPKKQ